MHAEGKFRLGEFCFAPVPAAKSVLLVLENGAVPVLEDLGESVVVLLLEAIKLDDAGIGALQDLDLVTLGGATPLRRGDVAVIEGEGVAAARRLPTEASFGKSALAALLGEVQVDVVETLAAN